MVWEEEKAPDVVIELLSDSTAQLDKALKKDIYQTKMRVTEYYWYDPFNPQNLAGFNLNHGTYQPIESTEQGWLGSQCLGLALVQWTGSHRGVEAVWLRWARWTGELLLTGRETGLLAQEQAQQAQEEAQQAQLQVQQERLRSDRLGEKLRELEVDPDDI